jgi:hypothetical protein
MESMETGNAADSAQQSPPAVDQVLINGEQSQLSPGGGSDGSTGSHDPGYAVSALFASLSLSVSARCSLEDSAGRRLPVRSCTLFLDVSSAWIAEGLRDYFGKFGEVNECMVMRDPATKRAR